MDRGPALLANHIKRTITGPMWHGNALAEVLAGVSHVEAAARPLPNAHSIWELVAHVTVWAEIARARLDGQRIGDATPEEDWPPVVVATDEAAWLAALERLNTSHRELAHAVRDRKSTRLNSSHLGISY